MRGSHDEEEGLVVHGFLLKKKGEEDDGTGASWVSMYHTTDQVI